MSAASLRRDFAEHEREWVTVAVAVLALIRIALLLHGLGAQRLSTDLDRYYAIVSGGVPYRDQAVEYPPVAVLVLEALHLVARSRTAFGVTVMIAMAILEAGLGTLMWRSFSRAVGLSFIAIDTLLYEILLTRIDVVATALAAVFAVLLIRRPVWAGFAWTAAVAAKLWPLALGVLVFDRRLHSRARLRAVAAGAASAAAALAGWLAIGGLAGVSNVITYRGAHGWQIESVAGAIVRVVSGATVYRIEGADRVGSVPPLLGPALLVVGTVAGLALGAVAARRGRWGSAWLVAVLCLLVSATLLSPQFLIWAVPGAALAWRECHRAARAAVAFIVAAGLTALEYRYYVALLKGEAFAEVLVFGRNAMLLVALGLAARASLDSRLAPGPAQAMAGAQRLL